MAVKDFWFEESNGTAVLAVVADDGLQVVFWPHPSPVPRPKLSYVLLRSFWSQEQLARYNVHESTGGGKFCLVQGREHGRQLGELWEEAHNFLDPKNMPATLRLSITADQRKAWDYVNGSLPYVQRLKGL